LDEGGIGAKIVSSLLFATRDSDRLPAHAFFLDRFVKRGLTGHRRDEPLEGVPAGLRGYILEAKYSRLGGRPSPTRNAMPLRLPTHAVRFALADRC